MEERAQVIAGKPKRKSTAIIKQFYPNSSLVRRARLIRRRTTNQYCERLKQLKEEDGIFIHQILIIRLKSKAKASDYERLCVGNSSALMIPSVDFAYPPMGSNSKHFPPPLFYPDFTKCTIQRKEGLEAFQVVLTNEKGDRTFAYCFKFLSKNWMLDEDEEEEFADKQILDSKDNCSYSVLVFVSIFSQENLFYQLATDFIYTIKKDSTKIYTICKDLLALTLTTSEEAYQNSKYVIPNDLKWSRCDVSTTMQKIGVENTVLVFLSLLAEKRILVTGSNVTDVCKAVQAFVHFLSPMEWPHTLIPIIPDSQIELCYNPTPYICGILRYNLSRVKEIFCPYGETQDEVTIVDVERGVVLPCLADMNNGSGLREKEFNARVLLNYATVIGFPKGVVGDMLNALKSCLPVKNPAKVNYKIEKNVMIFYAKLFGHYKRFGQDIMTSRNRKRFAAAHPCTDTRLFLKWFVENGILQSFIFAQRSAAKEANRLEVRFESILKKYSPPVDKKGKRRKAKSYLWRIFTL